MDFTDSILPNTPKVLVDGGGSFDIYRSRTIDGTVVAIKTHRSDLLATLDTLDKQRRVAPQWQEFIRIWTKCHHPNVVSLIGEVTISGMTATVHEWLDYGSVIEYLLRYPTANRYQLGAKICEGVAYLHAQDIIHGDLKGKQVLVSGDGAPRILLSGVSTHMMNGKMNDDIVFSVRWAAPELLEDEARQTFQSDIYALGMTILETTTSKPPYYELWQDFRVIKAIMNRQTPSRPMGVIPDNESGNVLWDLMSACWSYNPDERPRAGDVSEVMNALGLSQTSPQVNRGSTRESSMEFTPDIGIEDLAAFFIQNNIIDYTDELNQTDTKPKPHKPYLATPAALLYRVDLLVKGDSYKTSCTQKVMIKCVVNESSYKQLKRATRELYCWSRYKHDNVLPLLGFAILDGNLAMISPWVENGSVTGYVKKQQKPDYHGLCTQLSCAIDYLHHHGLIHGDIKGDNVLVSDEGIVKVTDFGVSIAAQLKIEFTYTAKGGGTERWQAPEILRRKTDSTKEGDVYALGMTMIEIYTQERPYGDTDLGHDEKSAIIAGTMRPKRPWRIPLNSRGQKFWELLRQCWAGNVAARPTSTEVYEQLRNM